MSALSNTYKKYYPREDKIINTVSNDIYKRILSAEKKQNTLC
jgi:CRISPR/Cas system CSM-associated protein Csm4 (group 5 of RAMP superfamily)